MQKKMGKRRKAKRSISSSPSSSSSLAERWGIKNRFSHRAKKKEKIIPFLRSKAIPSSISRDEIYTQAHLLSLSLSHSTQSAFFPLRSASFSLLISFFLLLLFFRGVVFHRYLFFPLLSFLLQRGI